MNYSTPQYISSTFGYGPFGMTLEGRNWVAGSENYRFGFNGMENDDETYGNNNALDFGSRLYDSRLGRWFSIDKKDTYYPFISPYSFALNNPIILLDIDGNEVVGFASVQTFSNGGPKVGMILNASTTFKQIINSFEDIKEVNPNNIELRFSAMPISEIEASTSVPIASSTDLHGGTGLYVITKSGENISLSDYVGSKDDVAGMGIYVAIANDRYLMAESVAETTVHEVTVHVQEYRDMIDAYYAGGNLEELKKQYTDKIADPNSHDDIANYSGDFKTVCDEITSSFTTAGSTLNQNNKEYPESVTKLKNISGESIEYDGKTMLTVKRTPVNYFIDEINEDSIQHQPGSLDTKTNVKDYDKVATQTFRKD